MNKNRCPAAGEPAAGQASALRTSSFDHDTVADARPVVELLGICW